MPWRMVLNVFKAIAISMVLIMVVDVGFYLYKAVNLNKRMESICSSLQRVVTENNYLPSSEYSMYMSLFDAMGNNMNGKDFTETKGALDQGDFVIFNDDGNAVTLNYNDSTGVDAKKLPEIKDEKGYNILRTQLNHPADYGDVMYIQASITIQPPLWGFGGNTYTGKPTANNWDRYTDSTKRVTFHYTYFVPCLKYQSVTE